MASIRPFRALRYSNAAGPIDSLTAPPYDVLTPAERDGYAVRNPHNIVHLTLPEAMDDDRSKFIKYARSAARLGEWRREGILNPEASPAIYRYRQRFRVDRNGPDLSRTSMIALLKTEPYDKGVVLPHEQTFPKHKEDRLRILEATRAHLECIFGLVEDSGEIIQALRAAPTENAVSTRSDDGVLHDLEPITDPAAIAHLVALLADRQVWIADGHHRYETAVAFREMLGERDHEDPEDYLPIALASMADPGLVLLPTHRVLSHLPIGREEILKRLASAFDIRETHSSRVVDAIAHEKAAGFHAFGMVFEGGLGYILSSKSGVDLRRGEGSDRLRDLDVSILHTVILGELLGVQGLDRIIYTRDHAEAIRLADEGAAAAFLMNPPSVEDMKAIALGHEKMPQKSTFYYPKVLSGLAIWSLNDFEA